MSDEAELCLPGRRQAGLVATSKVADGEGEVTEFMGVQTVWGRVQTWTFTLEEMGPPEGLTPEE